MFDRASLNSNPLNHRAELREHAIDRGKILASDHTVLARSIREAAGTYRRAYPQGGLFGSPVGYSFPGFGRTGIEDANNAALVGAPEAGVEEVVSRLTGGSQAGATVETALSPTAQRVAMEGLAGRAGAVVAIAPATGAITVLASTPTYDPNQLASTRGRVAIKQQSGAPLLDRGTQAAYAPGSTFKVVTAIAALESGYRPDSTLNGHSPIIESGIPLANFANEQFGVISLTEALTQSVNTVWAQVADHVGKPKLQHYMSALGFGQQPPVDLPRIELRRSGEFVGGHFVPATNSQVDLGRLGIGQDRLEVTPLQMAMVAAAVANRGRLMRPHLVTRIKDPSGIITRVEPRVYSDAFSPNTAAKVGQMMADVVKEGTGTAAALSGVEVAGKTGTAETGKPGLNQVWFMGFAPIQHPVVAVAATVEESPGQGGGVAAPIARRVIEALLMRG